ncbi:hypothetical protein SCALM49S_06843 [Streptomyces californicus]
MSTHGPALSAGESAGVTGIVLVGVALVLLAAFLSAAAQRVRQPAVMGEIVAGIALGPSLLGLLPGDLPGLLFPLGRPAVSGGARPTGPGALSCSGSATS